MTTARRNNTDEAGDDVDGRGKCYHSSGSHDYGTIGEAEMTTVASL